ncbi:MAG: exodeoxyribonuclease III [Peptoniphilus lacrimalis]
MKFISWNIDSLNAALTSSSNRAILTRAVLSSIRDEDPDLFAVQETKLSPTGLSKKHKEILEKEFQDYSYVYVTSKEEARKSYAGTMIFYKKDLECKASYPEIGAPGSMDMEGRIVTLEFKDFYFSTVYTPNAGDGLKRLSDRQVWDKKYLEYCQELDKNKPLVLCGDFNVAHKEIDLANPNNNHFSAGFTDEERMGFTNLLDGGFVDTFRLINGDVEGKYTWWAQRIKTSKINNSGWRIDYFLVSQRIKDKVKKSHMMDSGQRQDHTPIILEIDL